MNKSSLDKVIDLKIKIAFLENKERREQSIHMDACKNVIVTRGRPPHLARRPFPLVFFDRLYLLFYYRCSIEISHQHYYILWQQLCKIFLQMDKN